MNKAQLVESLALQLGGDKKTAAHAVEAVTDTIVRSVSKGEKVSITGFGVFEKRVRAARTARNPATGAPVKLKRTSVPAFRAGQNFKGVVSGAKKAPAAPKVAAKGPLKSAAKKTTAARPAAAAKKTAAKKSTATKSTAGTTARKSAAKSTAKKTTARASAAKKTTATKTTARKTTAKSAGTRAPAKKSSARKSATKRAR
ncbi:MAG: HU family DNA-binding protein [Mycobacteriales bacterium]